MDQEMKRKSQEESLFEDMSEELYLTVDRLTEEIKEDNDIDSIEAHRIMADVIDGNQSRLKIDAARRADNEFEIPF